MGFTELTHCLKIRVAARRELLQVRPQRARPATRTDRNLTPRSLQQIRDGGTTAASHGVGFTASPSSFSPDPVPRRLQLIPARSAQGAASRARGRTPCSARVQSRGPSSPRCPAILLALVLAVRRRSVTVGVSLIVPAPSHGRCTPSTQAWLISVAFGSR